MARETGRDPIVAVTGCVAQQEGEALLARSPGIIDIIAGTQRVRMLPMLVAQKREARAFPAIDVTTPYDEPSFPLGITRRIDPVKAYVTIIEGCNDFCAFCVVPYTRGHERMRSKAEILQRGRGGGLDGPHGSAAARPDREPLSRPGRSGLRLPGPARGGPRGARDRAHPVCQPAPAPYVGSPDCRRAGSAQGVQAPALAGAVRLDRRAPADAPPLRRDKSIWTPCGRFGEAIPKIQLSTDMIVGFPGETREDFEETLSLTESVALSRHVLVQVLGAAEHAGVAAHAGRCAGGRRRRGGSWRCSSCSAGSSGGSTSRRSAVRVEVLVDHTSRRRDWELSGRTDGNTVVNFPGDPSLVGQYRVGHRPACRAQQRVGRVDDRGEVMIEMNIKGLMVDPITNMPIIILRDPDGRRCCRSGSACSRPTRSRCRSRTSRRRGR